MFWVNIKEGVNNYSFEPLDVWSLLKDFPNDEHYYPLCAAIALFTNSEQVREIFILPKYNLPTK